VRTERSPRVQSGDPPELRADAVVSQYGRLVSSLCWRMTRNEEVAREAAQEVWVAVLEGLDGFRGDSSLSTWIYSIAWRVVSRYAQAQRTYSTRFLSAFFEGGEEPQAPAGTDVEHEVWVRSMCDQCLCGIAQCLEPDVRLAYLLRDVADLDYADVAQVLEIEPDAVRQMVSRARRKLQRFLSGHCSLSDPSGPCRCRMRRHVAAVDLPSEYRRLRRTAGRARVFKESELILPTRDYWLELSQTPA
jgi:RNA polymerase sigma factor (sigma-70 family)